MNKNVKVLFFIVASILGLALVAYAGAGKVKYVETVSSTEGYSVNDGVKAIQMCDGKTKLVVAVDGVKPGEKMPREVAQQVAGLMWNKYHEMNNKSNQEEILLAHGKPHTKREMMIWNTELKRMVDKGYKLFHSPELGTNGVSCDMCHPNASNTHPETYPKFQTQLKKMAHLRDMINWCIENPLEGPKLKDDDERIKALEAYIMWSKKGKVLEPGKH